MRTINQMNLKINMANGYKTQDNEQFEGNKIIKHDESQTQVVLAGAGLSRTDFAVENIKKGLITSGQNYKGSASNLMIEIDAVDSELRQTFKFLSRKLDSEIKHHIKTIGVAYDQGGIIYPNLGSLKYDGKIFYVKELHNEEVMGVPISPSMDASLGYKFFMYRLITSSKDYATKDKDGKAVTLEYKISPTHVVTFDKYGTTGYSPMDVIKQFKYLDKIGKEVQTHKGNDLNDGIFATMVADRTALTNIIKGVFAEHKQHCNTLKKVDVAYKDAIIKAVCGSAYEQDDQDYFIQYVTCREIFTLASIDKFCANMVEIIPDYFDEL